MMTIGKFIGCVMMVVGSAVGAGILGMPMVSAFAGFTTSVIVILAFWVLLTISGLLVAEASLALPDHACSFNSMAEKTLGPFGRTVTWVSYLLLLYSTLIAYISGGSELIFSIFNSTFQIQIPLWIVALLFTSVMGAAVFWSTKATDHLNRFLISIKGVLLITTLVLTAIYISPSKILTGIDTTQIKYVLVASPVLLCLFNYHFVIPSIRMYVGNKPQAIKWIIITGTTVSLVVYLFWLASSLSIVPLTGNDSFANVGQNLGEFVRVLTAIVHNKWVQISVHGFTNISMTTAFLGVSLGLFDFLADGFKRSDTRFGRLQTAGLTFIPPAVVVALYPHSFIAAFNYSGIFVAILFLILPPIMVYRLRKNAELAQTSPYRVSCGMASFAVITLVGVVFTIFPVLVNLGLFTAK